MPGSRAIITPERGLHRRSGRGPRNRGALLKAEPDGSHHPCTRLRLIYKVLIAGTWAERKGRNSIGHRVLSIPRVIENEEERR